jgi:molybdopterin molybdotransferase
VRIFTGAPLPPGADAILIQEDAERQGDVVTVREAPAPGLYIRPAGMDFAAGAGLEPPRRLGPRDLSLIAAMNAPVATVRRRPRVALLPTGDELVLPGDAPGPDQIVASSGYGIAALLQARGAEADLRPIAPDRDAARDSDLVVTLGGASVGEHDLVRAAIGEGRLDFHRIAMRPGKPLMAGRLGETPIVGLPGNPVSAMVCAILFLAPAVDAMLGLPAGPPPRRMAPLATPVPAGGPREHYMRAALRADGSVTPFEDQDSALQRLLAEADALVVRPPHAPPCPAGTPVPVIDVT